LTKRKDSAIPNSKEMERERKMGKKKTANCEYCSNYVYDEEYGYYTCDVDLDEDEMGRFMTNTFQNCPYFQMNDEYKIVRKQM
jgi:hypothetical protein